MKLIISSTAAALALLAAGTSDAAERQITLAVKNMSCATCEPIVRKSLARGAGVKRVQVSAEKGTATVVFDDSATDIAKLVAATTKAGYPSRPLATQD